jgi:hypothetical protein
MRSYVDTRFCVSFLQIGYLELLFWLANALAWNELMFMSCLVCSKQCCQCRQIYCAWELRVLYSCFLGWGGTTEKKNIFHGGGRCLAWSEQGAYRNSSGAACMSPVRSSTSYQGRNAEDPFPSHGYCAPIMRWPCQSHVRGILSSVILETGSRRGINMMQTVEEL